MHQGDSLPNDKILDWSKFKAFADDNVNVNEQLKFGMRRTEKLWKKEKMLVTSIFFFSHNVFKRLLSLKVMCGKELSPFFAKIWSIYMFCKDLLDFFFEVNQVFPFHELRFTLILSIDIFSNYCKHFDVFEKKVSVSFIM